jgi:hypothetical protein
MTGRSKLNSSVCHPAFKVPRLASKVLKQVFKEWVQHRPVMVWLVKLVRD